MITYPKYCKGEKVLTITNKALINVRFVPGYKNTNKPFITCTIHVGMHSSNKTGPNNAYS